MRGLPRGAATGPRRAAVTLLASVALLAGGSAVDARPQARSETATRDALTSRGEAIRDRIERRAESRRAHPASRVGQGIVSRVVDGVLTVISDAGDAISVTCAPATPAAPSLTKVNDADPGTGPARCDSIEFMEIFGGPDANAIDLAQVTTTTFPALFDTYVDGGAGPDSITVGSALESNYVHGGPGNDTITGGAGFDIVAFEGTPNADVLTATETQVTGGSETDAIAAVESFDLFGREGNDTLVAQFGDLNFLFGDGDADDLTGGTGRDFLFGHDFEDPFAAGADTLRGNAGDDFLDGAAGGDTLDAGEGNDYLEGGFDIDAFSAGAGNDEVWSRDYWAETVSCGEGPGADDMDVAEADPADVLNADCETRNVAAEAPFNTSPPTISGTPQEGQTLTANPGTWLGNPSSFAYEWYRCNLFGEGCVPIPGATAQSYMLTAADFGARIRVLVEATNSGGSDFGVSDPTAPVAAAPPPPPPPPAPPPPPPPPPKHGALTCTKWGTAGNDVVRGTAKRDVLCGLGGNDVLVGRGGADVLAGGAGNDRLTGGPGRDTFAGGAGRDTLYARDRTRDTVNGGAGRDRARVDAGTDRLRGVERRF